MRIATVILLSLICVATPLESFGGDWRDDEWQRNAALALIKTRQNPGVVRHPNDTFPRCNFFVAQYGTHRGIPYFRDIKFPLDEARTRFKPNDRVGGPNEDRVANAIHTFLSRATQRSGSGWVRIGDPQQSGAEAWRHAQALADAGRAVFGVKFNADGHGHIVAVVPSFMRTDPNLIGGSGPLIRDAQHPNYSVRASQAGSANNWKLENVLWVVWDHPDQNTLTLVSGKNPIKIEQGKPLQSPLPKEAPALTFPGSLPLLNALENRFRSALPPPPPPGGGASAAPATGSAAGRGLAPNTVPRGGIRVEIPLEDDDFELR